MNSWIAKSEFWDAYIPSFPKIPIPIFASRSIDTSFAPSPIERVILDRSACFIIQTMSAFSEGEIQQAMTASHVLATWIKISFCFKIPLNARASITIAHFLCWCLRSLFSSKRAGVNSSSACYSLWTSQMCMSGESNLQENPIFLAVSNLSPVSIQTLIWASLKLWIVSGTLS